MTNYYHLMQGRIRTLFFQRSHLLAQSITQFGGRFGNYLVARIDKIPELVLLPDSGSLANAFSRS